MSFRFCDGCRIWRHSDQHSLDLETRSVLCSVCGKWMRGYLTDDMYRHLTNVHQGPPPAPETHGSGHGGW
jgi:hypothetical protein